jgi:hypothetical protein
VSLDHASLGALTLREKTLLRSRDHVEPRDPRYQAADSEHDCGAAAPQASMREPPAKVDSTPILGDRRGTKTHRIALFFRFIETDIGTDGPAHNPVTGARARLPAGRDIWLPVLSRAYR